MLSRQQIFVHCNGFLKVSCIYVSVFIFHCFRVVVKWCFGKKIVVVLVRFSCQRHAYKPQSREEEEEKKEEHGETKEKEGKKRNEQEELLWGMAVV